MGSIIQQDRFRSFQSLFEPFTMTCVQPYESVNIQSLIRLVKVINENIQHRRTGTVHPS